MHDLNIFLSDEFQYKLKAKAAASSGGRFENTLDNYFHLFFDALERIEDAHQVNSLRRQEGAKEAYDWLNSISLEFKKDIVLYKQIFKEITYTYELFIRGKHFHATNHIFDVLDKYQMTDPINEIDLGLFYKGRVKKEGDEPNDVSYYYHIPFDQRFLTGNQRFSYSGQPILYLGSSILDVLYELRVQPEDYKSVAFASFGYDPLINRTFNKTKQDYFPDFKIYDITNHIYKMINEQLLGKFSFNGALVNMHQILSPVHSGLKKEFKKFILTQICTFKRTHGNVFVEEYVPAQILTEALRINKYHGVKFPSTQFHGKSIRMSNHLNPSSLQENLALFAEYSGTEKHDMNLLSYFTVELLDETITLSNSRKYYLEKFHALHKQFPDLCQNHYGYYENPILKSIINVSIISNLGDYLEVNNIPFFTHELTSLEFYAQLKYLEYLRDRFSHIKNGRLINQLEK